MATQTQIAAVQQLYIGYLGRAADKAGLDFWTNAVATGVSTLESVATGFTLSNEYKAAFGGLTNDALVEKVYTSVLGRASDTAGKAFWVDALAKGTVTADKLVATFIGALSAPDQTIINNKTFVAQTYTDTVGTEYNGAAGAAVIANVDGTPASVNAALTAISSGTLTGLVPGVSLINAIAAANAVKAAYGVEAATTNPTFDTLKADGTAGKDGVVDAADAAAAALKAANARADIKVGGTTVETSAAAQTLATANTALASAKALAQAGGATTAVAAFDAAVTTQKGLLGTATAADAKAAAVLTENSTIAAADVVLNANAGVANSVNYASLTAAFNNATTPAGNQATIDATSLKTLLDAGTSASKTALTTELAKLPTYGQATVDAAAKVGALVASENAVGTATTPGTAAAGVTDYAKAVLNQAAAADTVAKITVADAAVAAAKVVVDKYTALDSNIEIAQTALNTFAGNNSDKVTITDIAAVNATTQATAKSDVFYFGATKAVALNDFAIGGTTNFAAGDSIVLGSGYTFNSGALSTGNANTLEFFLVKGATGTQVVIETEGYGNSSTTVDTAGNVIASPNATVINLVGVTADHLAVNNGVISYV